MTLHEAMQVVLKENGKSMSSTDIRGYLTMISLDSQQENKYKKIK
tara:strand:- start:15 stop:149 length:135 start_codon:yes stop_codon:yes gene_type:complete